MIKHILKVAKSLVREFKKNNLRSPQWRSIQHKYLKENPTCASCGSKKHLQVHHIQPYHLYPQLELTSSNLITLCMDAHECHLLIGHGDNFKAYNPNVVEDSAKVFLNSEMRSHIVDGAKKNRILLETK